MFHIVLQGRIETDDDKTLISELEDLIKNLDGTINGRFVSYEVESMDNVKN